MLVLHGSATGTATDVAANLFRLARRYQVSDLQIASLQDIDIVQLVESDLAVFVVSTTGNGDVPASMHGFWSTLLRSDVDTYLLEDLDFIIIGLGDSKYAQFNWTAKKLRRRVLQLGGNEVLDAVMCDDSASEGQDTALLPFIKIFEDLLRELNGDKEPIPKDVILPAVCPVLLVDEQQLNGNSDEQQMNGNSDERRMNGNSDERRMNGKKGRNRLPNGKVIASMTSSTRLSPETHFQDIRLLTFALPAGQSIEPGDVLSLWPANSDASTDRFIELLGWQASQDCFIKLPANSKALDLFTDLRHITLRHFIKFAIPISGVPSLNLFSQLSQFTTDANFKEKFDEWEESDGKDDLYDYLTRSRRTLLEVIEDFASGIEVPIEHCVDLFGLVVSRSYSIAGAQSGPSSSTVELLVAMVKYQTRIKEPRQGLASRYLCDLSSALNNNNGAHSSPTLLVKLDKPIISANKMPIPPPSTPLLMICTGTGFAPLRFFITRLQSAGGQVVKQHDVTILVGCRSHQDDLITKSVRKSVLATISVIHAYSRMEGSARTYVQDLIPSHAGRIRSIIDRGGKIYLCGSSGAMPDAVRAAIDTVNGGNTVQMLEDQGRWWQETW